MCSDEDMEEGSVGVPVSLRAVDTDEGFFEEMLIAIIGGNKFV